MEVTKYFTWDLILVYFLPHYSNLTALVTLQIQINDTKDNEQIHYDVLLQLKIR